MNKQDSGLKQMIWVFRSKLHHASVVIDNFLSKLGLQFIVRWPAWLKAIFYLIPALSLLMIFTFYPIFNSFLISFYTGYNIQRGDFDGYTLFGNYLTVIRHANFGRAIFNTSMIVLISVPVTIFVGLMIAVALNAIKPLKGFYQSIFFLPYVTNSIAIGLVFAFMFKGNSNDLTNLGLANQILTWIGLKPIVWIGVGATYWSAMSVILIYSVWNGLAFKIIVFLAGIQGIDKQYYQAAQIDGASRSKSFYRITVPMISPMIFYILITSVIGSFKTYSSVVAIINRQGLITTGANGTINLKTIVFYIYDYIELASQDGLMSYASAAAIILFGIILVFTVIQLQVGKRRVHY
jgi:multiple sugar transport system permease protein